LANRKPANSIRRGAVFHFRRAVPRDLQLRLGRIELSCSLRTYNKGVAERLARELYLAADDLFAQLRRDDMLTENQIAEVVQDFYAYFIERDDKSRLASLPLSATQRQNRIDYWQRVAGQTRADLGGNDLSSAAMTVLGMQFKRKDLQSITAEESRQLQQALLRAGIDLAEALTARYQGDFNFEPRDKLLKAQIAKSQADNTDAYMVEPTAPSVIVVPEADKVAPAPLFEEVAKAFIARQIATKTWDTQTSLQARKTFELWSAINGNKPVGIYEKKDSAQFRATIERLPANYGKAAIFRSLTPSEIIAADLDLDAPRLSVRTVQRHVSALSQLWQHTGEGSDEIRNIFAGFKFRQSVRVQDERDLWTMGQLTKLFSSPIWAGCKSPDRRSTPGSCIIKDEYYWLPLLATFTGARQEELCQLHLEDVYQHDEGIWIIDINMKAPRRLKNLQSIRLVPIHSKLIELGFLEYLEERRRLKDTRVFPNLERGGAEHKLGHNYSKRFSNYRRKIGFGDDDPQFHSFRHTATTLMGQADVPHEIVARVVGHLADGETVRYLKFYKTAQLRKAVDSINIDKALEILEDATQGQAGTL
jgi:integrase